MFRDSAYVRFTLRSALAIFFSVLASVSLAQTRELVVAAWGDPYEAGWRKSLIPTFEKMYNVTIVWVPGYAAQTAAKLQAQRANPEIDVALLDAGPHKPLVALGIIEKIDRSKLSNAKYLHAFAFEPGDMGIGFSVDGTGMYYNKKAFADNKWMPPSSWLDLYKPEYKGKVNAHHISNGNGMCLLLALNRVAGGDETNLDRGFAKMKELAPSVVTFDKGGETPTLTQQGVVVVGAWSIGRAANLASSGVPIEFVYPKEGVCGYKQVATIIKGRPNQDLAYKFIDLLLSREQQEDTARYVGFGPLNRDAKLDAETARRVIYGADFSKLVWEPNWDLVNNNRSAWAERWNKEIEQR